MNVFEGNAAQLEKLRERVDEMFRERNKSPEHTAAWQEAALAFRTEYDKLAFPGGLSKEFELLRVGDVTAVEMALRFLEANPWFFRSGYYKVDILKLLRKQPLSDEQCARMRKVILEPVRDRPVRETRAYARFAPKVSTPDRSPLGGGFHRDCQDQGTNLKPGFRREEPTSRTPKVLIPGIRRSPTYWEES
jgi:hypothetical protein